MHILAIGLMFIGWVMFMAPNTTADQIVAAVMLAGGTLIFFRARGQS